MPSGAGDPFKELDAFKASTSEGIPTPLVPDVSDFDSPEDEMQGLVLTSLANDDIARVKSLLKAGASPDR